MLKINKRKEFRDFIGDTINQSINMNLFFLFSDSLFEQFFIRLYLS